MWRPSTRGRPYGKSNCCRMPACPQPTRCALCHPPCKRMPQNDPYIPMACETRAACPFLLQATLCEGILHTQPLIAWCLLTLIQREFTWQQTPTRYKEMQETRTLMRRYSGLRASLSSIPATPSAPATPSRAAAVERAKQRLRTTLSANGLPKAPSRMGLEPGSASGSPRVAAGQSLTIS